MDDSELRRCNEDCGFWRYIPGGWGSICAYDMPVFGQGHGVHLSCPLGVRQNDECMYGLRVNQTDIEAFDIALEKRFGLSVEVS